METTMAATPKARLATASATASIPLAFPVPPPPPSANRAMPAFAFPPPAELRHTRRTTVRVPRDSMSDSLAGIASWIESAPIPSLPEGVWTAIGRMWFFFAGTTMGVLLALALIAGSGVKRTPPHAARTAVSASSARVLVIQRPLSVAERGVGELAENDVVDEAPAAAPAPVIRRPVVTARRAPSTHRAPSGKDLLSAGL